MHALFAQAAGNGNAFDDTPPDGLWVYLLFAGVCILVWLAIALPFLRTLSKALGRCHPRNRAMEPHQVWLNLIPLFNLVWQFVTVSRVAESLRREFRRRRLRSDDFGESLGLAVCITGLMSWTTCLGFVYLICAIVYWAKIAGYSRRLARAEERALYEAERRRRYDEDHGDTATHRRDDDEDRRRDEDHRRDRDRRRDEDWRRDEDRRRDGEERRQDDEENPFRFDDDAPRRRRRRRRDEDDEYE